MKKIMIIMLSFFGFIFCFFSSMNTVSAAEPYTLSGYSLYKLTIPDVEIARYSRDASTNTFEILENTKTTIDVDFYAMIPNKSYNTSNGTSTEDYIHSRDVNSIVLYDSFYTLSTEVNSTSSTVVTSNMSYGELDDLLTYHWNYGAATKKSFDSYLDPNDKYNIPDMLFYSDAQYGSYCVSDLKSFISKIVVVDPLQYVTKMETFYTEDQYNQSYQEGRESVDITTDNETVYQEGYVDGQESVDITIDNQEAYNNGYLAGQGSIDITSDNLEVYQEGYNKGYNTGKEIGIEEGKASIDVNAIRQEAYNNGFNEGVVSVDITQDNQAIYEEAYQEGMDDGLIIGFENGKNSVDVSAIEQDAYDRGYQNGYNVGFAEGEYSVDITKDNDTAIHLYITQNKYHTDYEFKLNFDLGYSSGRSDGIKFVYDNIANDEVVTKYIKDYIYVNKYYTSTEYIDNYDKGYQAGFKYGYDNGFVSGKEVIYKTIESDPIIKEYYKEKLINGTKITFVNEGDEVVKVVKNYDIDETDTGDFKIIIHNGQDTFRIETVENVIPGESNTTEIVKGSDNSDLIDFFSKFGLILLVFIGTVGVIWLFKGIANISFKGRRNTNEKSFAV